MVPVCQSNTEVETLASAELCKSVLLSPTRVLCSSFLAASFTETALRAH